MLGENLNHRLKTMDEINKELASEDHRTKSEAGERISEGVLVPHSRTIYASGKDGILGDHDEWDGTLEDIQLFIECAKAGKGNFDWKDVQEILIEGGGIGVPIWPIMSTAIMNRGSPSTP